MAGILDKILHLTQRLYPRARAFRMPPPEEGGNVFVDEDDATVLVTEDASAVFVTEDSQEARGGILYRLHRALGQSEQRVYMDGNAILNSVLPDNDGFTIEDAHDWYRRLGIFDSGTVPFDDMKLAIQRRIKHPGTQKPRQNYRYVEQQLRAAGFDVHVYENRFWVNPPGEYQTKTPAEVLGAAASPIAVHDDVVLHGTIQHGGGGFNKIVNYVVQEKDKYFIEGTHLRNTFFIAGDTVDTFATVPANRKKEFRQLVLWLKPVHMVAYEFINYV